MKSYIPDLKVTPILLGIGLSAYAILIIFTPHSVGSTAELIQQGEVVYTSEIILLITLIAGGLIIDRLLEKQHTQSQADSEYSLALTKSLSLIHNQFVQDMNDIHHRLEQMRAQHPDAEPQVAILLHKIARTKEQLKPLAFIEQKFKAIDDSAGNDSTKFRIISPSHY